MPEDSAFPAVRNRRLRQSESMRSLVQETRLHPSDFIAPLFVSDSESGAGEIAAMPGVFRHTLDSAKAACERIYKVGIPAVAIFPHLGTSSKDATGSRALDAGGFLYRVIRELKTACPELLLMTDVALDPFTSHGHDGILTPDGASVANDETVEVLAKMAVLQAGAGADIVAPSDMMDGRVGAIRSALEDAGYPDTAIMSYAAKFASCLYGPFRDAVGSAGAAGSHHLDKRTYQMSPANARDAVRDALLDEAQGADFLMVKPAGWYLDVIRELRSVSRLPIAAYQVSGEYAMLCAATSHQWMHRESAAMESVLAIKRAGADVIITYFAEELARRLQTTG